LLCINLTWWAEFLLKLTQTTVWRQTCRFWNIFSNLSQITLLLATPYVHPSSFLYYIHIFYSQNCLYNIYIFRVIKTQHDMEEEMCLYMNCGICIYTGTWCHFLAEILLVWLSIYTHHGHSTFSRRILWLVP
jgi:hypothetical protein